MPIATHDNGSFWFDSLESLPEPEKPSSLPRATDVAIIGAGFTGLWTAYYLKQRRPDLSIAIFEAVTVGYGASGRNGGWCMGFAMGIEDLLASPETRQVGIQVLRAMHETVDEVGRVCQAENIDCHYQKGGTLTVATLPFRAKSMRDRVERFHSMGFSEDDYRWLPTSEAKRHINCASNHGASYTPHCAAIHPARLVKGLAERVRGLGVAIHELTPVTNFEPGRIHTEVGSVEASIVLRATEGYTDSISNQKRRVMPLYSMMVATEPLKREVWEEIGLTQRETFGDTRRVVIYGQRTLDNRLAFGGRGSYYFGSERKPRISPEDPMLNIVEQNMRDFFPILHDVEITHRWGGLMGVARHWRPSVLFDRETGLGSAGGYVGEGVAASNLAGRTLSDLVTGEKSDLTRLPWVGDQAERWEREPLRWAGAKAIQFIGDRADRKERNSNTPSAFWGGLFDRLFG